MVRIYSEEGPKAYWRGNWANVVRYFPTTALNFGFKGYYKNLFKVTDPDNHSYKVVASNVAAGGCAGASCMIFVYPLDFARTRLGVDVGKEIADRQFQGLTHCMQSIYKTDGIKGLYQGFGISVSSIFLYRGLYFGGYDTGKAFFPDYENRSVYFQFMFALGVTNFSEVLSYPFDTVRRRLMMNSGLEVPIYKNSMDCFR